MAAPIQTNFIWKNSKTMTTRTQYFHPVALLVHVFFDKIILCLNFKNIYQIQWCKPLCVSV